MIENIKLPKIHVNAEFQRLWWTNVSGGLLAGVLLVYALFVGAKDEHTSWTNHLGVIGAAGMGISAIVAYVLIERSLKQDVESNAFDQLRMSSLSPWQMAYSRMVVAPLLAWVGFAVGWVLLLLANVFNTDYYDADAVMALLAMPLLAWAFACVVLVNALQFGRGARQWSGSAIQLILAYIIGTIFFSYMIGAISNVLMQTTDLDESFRFWSSFDGANRPVYLWSAVLLAIFASVAAHAAMAQRLHLKSAHVVFLLLSLLSPLLFWWTFTNVFTTTATVLLCYGCAAMASILTQDNVHLAQGLAELKRGRFRLPAWVVLFPLGLLLALWLGMNVAEVYVLQVGGLLALVGTFARLGLRYQAVTVAAVVYLLGFFLFVLVR